MASDKALSGFGHQLRSRRRALGLTQRELSKRVGLDFTYISKMETDSLERPPSVAAIESICAVLDWDAEEALLLAGQADYRALWESAEQRIAELEAALEEVGHILTGHIFEMEPCQRRALLHLLEVFAEEESWSSDTSTRVVRAWLSLRKALGW